MSDSIYSGRVRTRGCALVVAEKKLLLVKQHVPTRPEPVWLAPGGEVEMGETAMQAAIRETLEETGLQIETTRLVAVHEFIEPPFHAVELYFLSKPIGGTLKIGSDPEHEDDDQQILDCRFVGFDELGGVENISPVFLKELGKDDLINSKSQVFHFAKGLI